MNHKAIIRFATVQDSARLLKIYSPFVLSTAVSFEYTVPEEAEFAKRIKRIASKLERKGVIERYTATNERYRLLAPELF